MSTYEISLLAGSLMVAFGLLALVASLTNKRAIVTALFFLTLGGGAFYYAHISNFDSADLSVSIGLNLTDIPDALYKLAGRILN